MIDGEKMSIYRFLITLLAGLAFSISANATPITGASLHGASGALDVTLVSGNNYDVTWSLDTTGFDDAGAVSTDHQYLTEVAFKIAGMTNVTLLDAVGTLYFPSNVSGGGCATGGSPAGLACVALSPLILATFDQVISVGFNVDLASAFDVSNGISFRGKYGTGDGWVISESSTGGTPVAEPSIVPEPSILILLGLGLAGLGFRQRKKIS